MPFFFKLTLFRFSERAVPHAHEPPRDQILAWPEVWLSRSRILRSRHVRVAQTADRRCQKSGNQSFLERFHFRLPFSMHPAIIILNSFSSSIFLSNCSKPLFEKRILIEIKTILGNERSACDVGTDVFNRPVRRRGRRLCRPDPPRPRDRS